jgi:hypothetical protein
VQSSPFLLPDPALAPDPVVPPDPLAEVWRELPLDHLPAHLVEECDAAVPDESSWLPEGLAADLDSLPPGPLLADLLAGVDLDRCSDDQVVQAASAAAKVQAWAASREVAATAALVARASGWRGVSRDGTQRAGRTVAASRMAAAELGAALALSPRSAANRVALALDLARLPATRTALAAGAVDLAKARMVIDNLRVLDDEGAAAVDARVLPSADGLTWSQLHDRLRRAVVRIDPAAAEERRRRSAADRRVERFPLADGMAGATWIGTAETVESFWIWLTATATAARGADDPRTIDQARADVLADLGETGLAEDTTHPERAERSDPAEPGRPPQPTRLPTRQGRRPQIQVVVSLATLLGLDDRPGELAGYGPITAEVARKIACEGTWRRLLTDPRTGRFDELSVDTYEPPQDMRDHVIARDRTCREPGCRMPADRSDLDHRIPHPRGPTHADNLYAACRSFHEIKTLTDTRVVDDGEGGMRVTYPSGRTYHRPADPVLPDPMQAGPAVDPELDVPPF